MRTAHITAGQLTATLLVWWVLFILFATNAWNPFGLLHIFGTAFLLLVPGALTLTLLRVRQQDPVAYAVLALGLSVLELMALGLMSNAIFPLFGVVRPLDTVPVLWAMSTLFLVLLTLTWWRFSSRTILIPAFDTGDVLRNVAFVVVPVVFVIMSVIGAVRLNEGGTNTVTMLMLAGAAVYSWFLYRHAERLHAYVLPFALFMLSLALLLMTSLRGVSIAGHDIQREFFVFQLAKDAGVWSMAAYLDAYNACMSITILPTILSNMLHVPDPYVYKVLFQVLFAAAPVTAFLIARRWLEAPYAFLAGLFFIAFPTFFQDMPFLIRQEVAFLFYGLMIYVLFEDAFSRRLRAAVFVLLGIGVILSHYSTTYTILFILLLTTFTTPILFRLARYLRRTRMFSQSAFGFSVERAPLPVRRVTVPMVLTLTLAALLWTSVITNTDTHVRDVTQNIWSAVVEGVDGGSRSVDVLVLFSLGRVQHDVTLEEYVENVVLPQRERAPDDYYATSTFAQYRLVTLERAELPQTAFGNTPENSSVNIASIVTFLGQLLAKLIQIAIVVGFVYVLFRNVWTPRLDTEYYILSTYALFFVVLCVALPILSVEYGVFRALQQSLFLLSPLLVVGVLVLGSAFAWLLQHWYRLSDRMQPHVVAYELYAPRVAGVLGVFFLLYASGFMTQLVGGNIPPVHLNNVGDDYDHYVTEARELEAISWLEERLAADMDAGDGIQPVVQADRFGQKKLRAFILERIDDDILPASIRKDAYVYVGPATLLRGTAVVNYDQARIKYVYPLTFLDENKEVVYDNGSVRIYK